MPKQGYAEYISNAQLMVAGLKENATQLARRGIDEAFTSKMDADQKAAVVLNNEQEKLKADLKTKTAELDAKIAELELSVSEARKIVKIEIPQSQWVSFGITDKK